MDDTTKDTQPMPGATGGSQPAPAPQPAPRPTVQPIAPGSPGNPPQAAQPTPAPQVEPQPAPATFASAPEPKRPRTVRAGVTAAIAGGALVVGLLAGGRIASAVAHVGDHGAFEHAERAFPGGSGGGRGGDARGFAPERRGDAAPDASEEQRGSLPDDDSAPGARQDERGSAPQDRDEATPDSSATPEDATQGA